MLLLSRPFTLKKIDIAYETLKNGGIVVFPTETVYGLGANALDETACKKIFTAKGRPNDNPLIVHIGEKSDLIKYGKNISQQTLSLVEKFWPGPLTVIVKKRKIIGPIVSGGLDTVALRLPTHSLAQKLIQRCGFPIAAPSANLSGKPSPTNAKNVIEDLKDEVDIIFDGGDSTYGLESTVIDMTSKVPTILRHGSITIEMIKKILPNVTDNVHVGQSKKSPGTKYRHYAPETPVVIVTTNERDMYLGKKEIAYIGIKIEKKGPHIFSFTSKSHLAKNLYSTLRKCDTLGVEKIIVESVKETGIGKAIMNRLKKASGVI